MAGLDQKSRGYLILTLIIFKLFLFVCLFVFLHHSVENIFKKVGIVIDTIVVSSYSALLQELY